MPQTERSDRYGPGSHIYNVSAETPGGKLHHKPVPPKRGLSLLPGVVR